MSVFAMSMFSAASDLIQHSGIRFIVQAAIVLGLALVAARLLSSRSAALRSSLLVTAQLIALGIPFVALAVPAIPVLPSHFAMTRTLTQPDQNGGSRRIDSPDSVRRIPEDLAERPATIVQPAAVLPQQPEFTVQSEAGLLHQDDFAFKYQIADRQNSGTGFTYGTTALFVVIWVIGSCTLLLRLVVSMMRLALLARRGTIPVSSRVDRVLQALQADVAARRRCQIIVSRHAKMPMAWGIFRFVILLPERIAEGNEPTLRSVAAHELAHVQRHDPLKRLMGQLCVAAYWFNPLAWLVLRNSAVLAEHACDDRVLRQGIAPAEYAEHLVQVVRDACSTQQTDLALAMSRPSHLRQRIAAVLDSSANRRLPDRRELTILAGFALIFLLPMSAIPQNSPEPQGANKAPQDFNEQTKANLEIEPRSEGVRSATIRPGETVPIRWEDRRIAGYPVVRGRVVDAKGEPVPNVDVGLRWESFHDTLTPGALVMTDAEGQFELCLLQRQGLALVMAMNKTRENGGLAVVNVKSNASVDDNNRFDLGAVVEPIDVVITLEPLVDVSGSYWTTEAHRRPRHVWTSVKRLPDNINIIEQNIDSPFFSFRLPAGRYFLRGSAANFTDVHREIVVDATAGPVELPDLPLPVSKLALFYGQPAPDFQFTGGQRIEQTAKLADYKGKWVVLEFWGAWCRPCIFQMEQLFMFSDEHEKDRNRFEIITVHHDLPDGKSNFDEDLPKLLKRWKRDEFPYSVAFDRAEQMVNAYGVTHFPTTVFIDPEGQVAPVNGIWGLSDILKGRAGKEPELFQADQKAEQQKPAAIKQSNENEGICSQRCVSLTGHTDMVAEAAFLPDGKHFVTAASDNTIRFWDIESHVQTGMILCTPNANSISSYGGIHLFMAQKGNLIGGFFYEQIAGKVVHSPRLWRADTNYQEYVSLSDPEFHFGTADVTPNGHRLAAYTYSLEAKVEFVRIYDLTRGTFLYQLDVHGAMKKEAVTSSAIKFSPDGRYLAVSGSKGRSIQVWDADQGRKIWEQHPAEAYGVNSISFSSDGSTLACATWSEPLEIRSTLTGDLARTLRSPGHRPVQVAISPNGRHVATASNTPFPRIKIWDMNQGVVVGTLVGHPTGIRADGIAWSPDGRSLVSVGGANTMHPGEVLLWDLTTDGIIE